MRVRTVAGAALVAAVLISSAAVAGATPSARSGSLTAAVPAGTCAVQSAVIVNGRYQYRHVNRESIAQPPEIVDYGALPSGTTLRAMSTGTFDADPSMPGMTWVAIDHFANSTRNLFAMQALRHEQTGVETTLDQVGTRWGGFRRLVYAGRLSIDHPYLYGLHDDGSLYRYRVTYDSNAFPSFQAAGRVGGFGDLRTIAIVGQTSSYDALIANTTGGQLVVIKIPTTSSMQATRTVIRTRTWQGFDHLAVGACPEGGTLLVGVNSTTGRAYAYSMAFLRNTSSSIVGHGQVGGTWKTPLFSDVQPLGEYLRGA